MQRLLISTVLSSQNTIILLLRQVLRYFQPNADSEIMIPHMKFRSGRQIHTGLILQGSDLPPYRVLNKLDIPRYREIMIGRTIFLIALKR